MDDDVKEMIWECENNSKYKAQESFCNYNFQPTPLHHRRFDRSIVRTLHKPFLNTEVSKPEKNMAFADNTKLTPQTNLNKAKQNGNGHAGILPAHLMFLQKPARIADVESRKISRTFNAAVGKANHTMGSVFEKSFPIKNAANLSSWSGACRRSPKKTQRLQMSTVEETVRAEEKEMYRQLIQVVTGKTFLSTNSTTFLPPDVSRRLSLSSVSGQPGASSLSSLEPCTLDVEPTYQPPFSLVPEKQTPEPLATDATFKLACEERHLRKQLHKEEKATTQEQYKGFSEAVPVLTGDCSRLQNGGEAFPAMPEINFLSTTELENSCSDSVVVLDPVPKEDSRPSGSIFHAELWIKELTSRYDSRARERRRMIEEQKALAIKLQNQRLQERSVHDAVDLNLRVPLEKEIPVTLLPKPVESVPEEQEFPELTPEMEKEIKHALYGGSQDQVLSEAFRLTITRKDIMTLNSLNWLNDEIINFYMNLLMERSKRKGFPKVHAFNTFFFPKLKCAGFQAVKRWTKKVDIFDVDILLVPVHLGVHWCLAVVDFRKKTITYYDSMGGHNNEACRILLQYLKQESQDKKGVAFDTNGWTLCSKKSNEIPQQMNGSDCGMFTCKYADYITKDRQITFTQHHMPYFRKRMVWEIIHQKFL